ncbi:MAG: DUF4363 family protein [Ruminococcus sp.]|nr:DUF4363 family protein [Ruminococcus sp.]
MKRGWIALAMIALSLLLGGIEAIYVTSNADVYVQMLDDADEKMANNQVYEAESVAGRLDTRFSKQSAVFNVFMYHSEMETISSNLAMLRRYAQTGSTEDFLATSAYVKRQIMAVRSRMLLSWENIF